MSAPEDTGRAHDSSYETAAQPREARADSTVRFTPGTLLAGRYRIVSPLGKGGMGEVYRADDIRLGQPVALKFLSAAFAADAGRIERLVDEVRVGRQISHPNVCRLYDITEAEGHHFLVMEYVDGEDLASLLRRIGRLPGDKALDIARGVCAGLAAAHDKGIIHRDLKPANVMIDGHGRARIADFGLAALAHSGRVADMSGTPQYMAPERLTGESASLRSDVYALGLVLHEMLTGKKVYEAESLDELRALHAETKPPSLSSATDVDPAFERLILHCLARNPNDRPASARLVLALLPGGDQLEAALLAGETPTPAMVAAASVVGDLSPQAAWLSLGAALLGLVVACSLSERLMLHRLVPLPKSPEVLVDRARTIAEQLVPGESIRDSAWGFEVDPDTLYWITDQHLSRQQFSRERPGPIVFWFRASPQPLAARTWVPQWPWIVGARPTGRVTRHEPPSAVPGMSEVVLDTSGHLLRWRRVVDRSGSSAADLEGTLSLLFGASGLAEAQPSSQTTTPTASKDVRVWRGGFPDARGRVRVEAAIDAGRVVSFAVFRDEVLVQTDPTNRSAREIQDRAWSDVLLLGIPAWVGIAVLVIRNLRLKRGDRRGATFILLFGALTGGAALKLMAHFPPSLYDALDLWMATDAQAIYWAVLGWILYIALEPAVRSTWPHTLVAWSRLVAGRLRDPLVGRDVLWGVSAGTLLMGSELVGDFLAEFLLNRRPAPLTLAVPALASNRDAMAVMLQWLYPAALLGAFQLLLLLIFYRLTRGRRSALVLLWVFDVVVLSAGLELGPPDDFFRQAFVASLAATLIVGMVFRLGLLSTAVMGYVFLVLLHLPLTTHRSSWYADASGLGLLVVGGLAIYGFVVSLAGKTPFERPNVGA